MAIDSDPSTRWLVHPWFTRGSNVTNVPAQRTSARSSSKRIVVTKRTVPGLAYERELWSTGIEHVVGIDEVGRGSWAGPISVGAAVLPRDRRVNNIRDSKMLTEKERERIFDRVAEWCTAWAVGHATHEECDVLGMAEAQRLAARRAIEGLGVEPGGVLIDGNWDFVGLGNTHRLIKGDARCLSIASASILAKVTRDRIMRAESAHYPYYDFDKNKGYPCPRHKAALRAYGPSAIHRRRWAFMNDLPWGPQPAEDGLGDSDGQEALPLDFTS